MSACDEVGKSKCDYNEALHNVLSGAQLLEQRPYHHLGAKVKVLIRRAAIVPVRKLVNR